MQQPCSEIILLGDGPVAELCAQLCSRLALPGGVRRLDTPRAVELTGAELVVGCLPLSRVLPSLPKRAALFQFHPDHDTTACKALIRRQRLTVTMSHPLRFHPGFCRLKEIVVGGVLGPIQTLTIECRGVWPLALGPIQGQPGAQAWDLAWWWLDHQAPPFEPADGLATGQGAADLHDGPRVSLTIEPVAADAPAHYKVAITGQLGEARVETPLLMPSGTGATVDRVVDLGNARRHASLWVPAADPWLLELAAQAALPC